MDKVSIRPEKLMGQTCCLLVDVEVHKRLKKYTSIHGMTLQKFTEEAILEKLEREVTDEFDTPLGRVLSH